MIAMGGNSLSPKNETGGIHQQFENTRKTLEGISHFIDHGYNLCINHGNGPQEFISHLWTISVVNTKVITTINKMTDSFQGFY